jgi:hypothetical protein
VTARTTALTLAVFALGVTACGSGVGSTAPSHGPAAGLTKVRRFQEYPLFWLGPTYGGLKLTGVDSGRVDVPSADHTRIIRTHSHTVTFLYGTCTPGGGDEQSCPPPLQVQNWPSCGRNAALYGLHLPLRLHVRGVPAMRFGGRLEIWTGTSDVVIFFADAARAAAALRSVGGAPHIGPGQRLPQPAPGAIGGRLRCVP